MKRKLTAVNKHNLIDNAWANKNFLYYLTFRRLQHTSSEVNGYNCYKHLKNTKIKRGTGDKIKNNDKIDFTDSLHYLPVEITKEYSFSVATDILPRFNSLIKRVSLILHCKSDFPVARISKWSHLML